MAFVMTRHCARLIFVSWNDKGALRSLVCSGSLHTRASKNAVQTVQTAVGILDALRKMWAVAAFGSTDVTFPSMGDHRERKSAKGVFVCMRGRDEKAW